MKKLLILFPLLFVSMLSIAQLGTNNRDPRNWPGWDQALLAPHPAMLPNGGVVEITGVLFDPPVSRDSNGALIGPGLALANNTKLNVWILEAQPNGPPRVKVVVGSIDAPPSSWEGYLHKQYPILVPLKLERKGNGCWYWLNL